MSHGQPLRSIAVFGGGVVALSAAVAFARALPRAALTWIATPVHPAALADRLPTLWPSSAAMLHRLGLDERMLVVAGAANHRLAQRFTHWSMAGDPWMAPEGEPIGAPGRGALHQRWLDAAGAGLALPYHALFPAAALAEAERFALPLPPALDRTDHALRLDPAWLVQAMADALRRGGARAADGSIDAVQRGDDVRITAIQLADGRRVEADLYVDATGPASALQAAAPRISWNDSLPADRLLVTPDAAMPPSLVDSYEAVDCGWSARWPMPGGGVRALAYNGAASTEPRARRALGVGRDSATLVACSPGRLEAAWRGNCLALGEAAAQPGPLTLPGFSLALTQLGLALDLLPGRDLEPLLIAEYNRRAALRADRVCDAVAAHYLLGARSRGPFWQALQGRTVPPTLAATTAQFRRRGHLPHHEEESVNPDGWRAMLIGQGLRPERRDPVAMSNDPVALSSGLQAARAGLAAAVAAIPPYRDWLAGVRR